MRKLLFWCVVSFIVGVAWVTFAQGPGLYSGPFKPGNGILFTQLPSTQCGTSETCQSIGVIYPQVAAELQLLGMARQLTVQPTVDTACTLGEFYEGMVYHYACVVQPGMNTGVWRLR